MSKILLKLLKESILLSFGATFAESRASESFTATAHKTESEAIKSCQGIRLAIGREFHCESFIWFSISFWIASWQMTHSPPFLRLRRATGTWQTAHLPVICLLEFCLASMRKVSHEARNLSRKIVLDVFIYFACSLRFVEVWCWNCSAGFECFLSARRRRMFARLRSVLPGLSSHRLRLAASIHLRLQ